MKPLVPAVLSLLLCSAVPLRAQVAAPETADSLKDLKKKYAKGGQKPDIKEAAAAETAPIPDGTGMPIADLEKLLLKSPECRKNPEDTAQLAAELKGKYGLVTCMSAIDGLLAIVLVPPSTAVPGQQLRYGSMPGVKLVGARLVEHYLVVQFDSQTQYLDMLKSDEGGFALAGYLTVDHVSRFEDMAIFIDALKQYGGVRNQELLSKVPASTAKLVNGKPFRMSAAKIRGEWVITVTHNAGQIDVVWPEKTKP